MSTNGQMTKVRSITEIQFPNDIPKHQSSLSFKVLSSQMHSAGRPKRGSPEKKRMTRMTNQLRFAKKRQIKRHPAHRRYRNRLALVVTKQSVRQKCENTSKATLVSRHIGLQTAESSRKHFSIALNYCNPDVELYLFRFFDGTVVTFVPRLTHRLSRQEKSPPDLPKYAS